MATRRKRENGGNGGRVAGENGRGGVGTAASLGSSPGLQSSSSPSSSSLPPGTRRGTRALGWAYVTLLMVFVGTAHHWLPSADLHFPQKFPTFGGLDPPSLEGVKDCSWPTVGRMMEEFMEIYSLLHFVNWFFAGLILENPVLVWMASLIDEFVEVMNGDLIPTYKECWFDHIGSDLLGCNLMGALLGSWVSRRLLRRKHLHFLPSRFGLSDSFLLGMLHTSLFNFGFSMKHALRLDPTSPLFVIPTFVLFGLEAAGQRSFVSSRLEARSPRPLPATFWAYAVTCALLWPILAVIDPQGTLLLLIRSAVGAFCVALGHRVVSGNGGFFPAPAVEEAGGTHRSSDNRINGKSK